MHKDFKDWGEKKEKIHYVDKEIPYFVEREIWWCSLGINIGVEIDGKSEYFLRPTIILKRFNKDMIFVLSLTNTEKIGKYYIDVIGEDEKLYKACISQARTISTKRLFKKITTISVADFNLLRKYFLELVLTN